MLLGETGELGEEPVPGNYNHKNSGWNGLVLNPGLWNQRPTTNRMSHGMTVNQAVGINCFGI